MYESERTIERSPVHREIIFRFIILLFCSVIRWFAQLFAAAADPFRLVLFGFSVAYRTVWQCIAWIHSILLLNSNLFWLVAKDCLQLLMNYALILPINMIIVASFEIRVRDRIHRWHSSMHHRVSKMECKRFQNECACILQRAKERCIAMNPWGLHYACIREFVAESEATANWFRCLDFDVSSHIWSKSIKFDAGELLFTDASNVNH